MKLRVTRVFFLRTRQPPTRAARTDEPLIPRTLARRDAPEVKVRGVLEYLRARGASVGRQSQRYSALRYTSARIHQSREHPPAPASAPAFQIADEPSADHPVPWKPRTGRARRLAPRWSRASRTASGSAPPRASSFAASTSASPPRGSTTIGASSSPKITNSPSFERPTFTRPRTRCHCRAGCSNPRSVVRRGRRGRYDRYHRRRRRRRRPTG